MCREFSSVTHGEFEMSLMEELNYLSGLQIKQMEDDTFISQTKYGVKLLKKYDMKNFKTISTPMISDTLIDKDENEVEIEIAKY